MAGADTGSMQLFQELILAKLDYRMAKKSYYAIFI